MARIMIVDDEPPVREALQAVIDAAGHETCAVSDGGRCLAELDSFRPDLVITDILMPGMEGMQTINELRKRQPALPIIAISGGVCFGDMNFLRTAERLGASHSILKPVSPQGLITAIAALLGHNRAPSRPIG